MTMQHGTYVAVVEYEEEEGAFHGRVVNLARDGFDFWGASAEELKAAFAASAAEYEEFCREHGREPETPTPGSLDFTKPHVLRNEEEYRLAEERIRVLLRKELEPHSDEWEELLFLSVLVEAYEEEHHPIEPIEVTEENFGDLLIKGLREAVAIERGELKPARVSRSEKLRLAKELAQLCEDLEDAAEAEEALKEAEREGTIPWNEVKRELGLDRGKETPR